MNTNEQPPKENKYIKTENFLPTGKTMEDISCVKLSTKNGELRYQIIFKGNEEDNQDKWISVLAEDPVRQTSAMSEFAEVFKNHSIEIDDEEIN
jgi:hypothetical protein